MNELKVRVDDQNKPKNVVIVTMEYHYRLSAAEARDLASQLMKAASRVERQGG